jgi:hypothetical protein
LGSNEFGHELDSSAFLEFCKSVGEFQAPSHEKLVKSLWHLSKKLSFRARSFAKLLFLYFKSTKIKLCFVVGASTKRFVKLSWARILVLIVFAFGANM